VAGDGALWFLKLLLLIFSVWKIYEKIINYEVDGDGAKCFLLLATVGDFTECDFYYCYYR
jgi:hypothetical protein